MVFSEAMSVDAFRARAGVALGVRLSDGWDGDR
jgi:hypothetical protein